MDAIMRALLLCVLALAAIGAAGDKVVGEKEASFVAEGSLSTSRARQTAIADDDRNGRGHGQNVEQRRQGIDTNKKHAINATVNEQTQEKDDEREEDGEEKESDNDADRHEVRDLTAEQHDSNDLASEDDGEIWDTDGKNELASEETRYKQVAGKRAGKKRPGDDEAAGEPKNIIASNLKYAEGNTGALLRGKSGTLTGRSKEDEERRDELSVEENAGGADAPEGPRLEETSGLLEEATPTDNNQISESPPEEDALGADALVTPGARGEGDLDGPTEEILDGVTPVPVGGDDREGEVTPSKDSDGLLPTDPQPNKNLGPEIAFGAGGNPDKDVGMSPGDEDGQRGLPSSDDNGGEAEPQPKADLLQEQPTEVVGESGVAETHEETSFTPAIPLLEADRQDGQDRYSLADARFEGWVVYGITAAVVGGVMVGLMLLLFRRQLGSSAHSRQGKALLGANDDDSDEETFFRL